MIELGRVLTDGVLVTEGVLTEGVLEGDGLLTEGVLVVGDVLISGYRAILLIRRLVRKKPLAPESKRTFDL